MVTQIEWVSVKDGMPRIGDPDCDPGAIQTNVLIFWDGGVYSGWPLGSDEDDPGERPWETSEFAHCLYGVTHWAYWNEPLSRHRSAPESGGGTDE